jgi:hypothetical protein
MSQGQAHDLTADQLVTELSEDIQHFFAMEFSDNCIPLPALQHAIERRFVVWVADLQHYGQDLPWKDAADAWEHALSYSVQAVVQVIVDLLESRYIVPSTAALVPPRKGEPHAS